MAEIENRGPELSAVAASLCGLAVVATALRCYVRTRLLHAFGTDDWFMIVALISFILNTACCICGAHYGSGRHYWDLTPEGMSAAFKYWWFCYLSYATTMIAAKVSIALFLLRITRSKLHNWIIWIATALTVVCGIAFFFIAMLQCKPVEYFWTRALPTEPAGKCIDIDVIIIITYTYSAISIVTDFTFSILPIFMIWQLQMDLKTKLALIPILSMACIASCAVAVRLAYVEDFRTQDFLWATTDIAIWSQIEQGLAVTAGSLATLRPLFRIILGKFGLLSAGSDMRPTGREDGVKKSSNGQSGYTGSGGRTGNSGGRSKRRGHHSLFSLSTFNRADEDDFPVPSDKDESAGSDRSHPIRGDYRVTIQSNNNNNDSWKLQKRQNESQEELNVRVTKETICTAV